jgi:signal peptidase II
VILTLAAAQLSSYLVVSHLGIGQTYLLTAGVHVTHIRNYGGVFGMFQGNVAIFGGVSALIVLALVAYAFQQPGLTRAQHVCLGLVVGAAVGNIADRLVYGSVVDFIDIQGIPHWQYIFNTADVALHLGIWPLVLIGAFGGPALQRDKPDEQQPAR